VTAFHDKRSRGDLEHRAERMYRIVRDIAVSAERFMNASPQE